MFFEIRQFLFMRPIRTFRALAILFGLLVCLRAFAGQAPTQLPEDVTLDKKAGRGGYITLPVSIEGGEELLFVLDTGSPITLLDRSLEPKLRKRLETVTFSSPGGGTHDGGIYIAPKLFLGKTPLMTDVYVATYKFGRIRLFSGRPVHGIIGLDCLRHYCIQLDFKAGKMRFLASERVHPAELGKSYPLFFANLGADFPPEFAEANQNQSLVFINHGGLLGGDVTRSLIDTGDNVDGAVESDVIHGHYGKRFLNFLIPMFAMRFEKSTWDGQTYTNLEVASGEGDNVLGLRFLARHLVTFDFPNYTLYLKQQSAGPLGEKR
jgi:hypothetical protein